MSNQSKNPFENLTREELDEVFDMMASGGLDPNPPPVEEFDRYDFRGILKYMKEKGKTYFDLTKEEIDMFVVETDS